MKELNWNHNLTRVIFINDIVFNEYDLLRLAISNNLDYDMVCAMDFYFNFYDTWVSHDKNNDEIDGVYPYFY